jgi:hypothetical protein
MINLEKLIIKIPKYILIHFYRIIVSFFAVIPQVIFGNSVGFVNNILPRLLFILCFFKQRNFRALNFIFGRSKLKKDGFIILRNSQSKKKQKFNSNFFKKIDILFKDKSKVVYSPNKTQIRVIDPVKSLPELKQLIPSKIYRYIRSYYGTNLRVYDISVWRNLGQKLDLKQKVSVDLMSNTLHNDNWPISSIRIFVYLSKKTTKSSGAFKFIDAVKSKKLFRSLEYFHRDYMTLNRKIYLNNNVNYFEGSFGDIAIVNTQFCLHGSTVPNFGNHRDMLQIVILPDYLSSNQRRIFSNPFKYNSNAPYV